MKAVMMSIRPKWCGKIASGEKSIEVRKNKPKLELPFKCYIYCTKGCRNPAEYEWCDYEPNGMVVGEFVCDKITYLGNVSTDPWDRLLGEVHEYNKQLITKQALLSEAEIHKYAAGKMLYGWHISQLQIYDKPKALSEFIVEGECDCLHCSECAWIEHGNGYNLENDCFLAYDYLYAGKSYKPLFKTPQSWCYVECLEENDESNG